MLFRLAGLFLFATFSIWAAGPKVLLVVAHPDDEYYFAATTYRIAQELDGTVDQVIITNGEAGYRYSTLAEKYYREVLTEESAGRAKLPEIRREETLRAGKILGIRQHFFLEQKDSKFTLDPKDALIHSWDTQKVRDFLESLIEKGSYDFLFVLLPVAQEHGHHQAATLLALEAASHRPEQHRPIVLGAEPGRKQEPAPVFTGRPDLPLVKVDTNSPVYVFDRTKSFGFKNALRYEIVVNWVIAEHKSQGMFQNDCGRHDVERFWILESGVSSARAKTDQLFSLVTGGLAK